MRAPDPSRTVTEPGNVELVRALLSTGLPGSESGWTPETLSRAWVVLIDLATAADQDRVARLSPATLAARIAGCHETHIQHALDRLQDCGAIRQVSTDPLDPAWLIVLPEPPPEPAPPPPTTQPIPGLLHVDERMWLRWIEQTSEPSPRPGAHEACIHLDRAVQLLTSRIGPAEKEILRSRLLLAGRALRTACDQQITRTGNRWILWDLQLPPHRAARGEDLEYAARLAHSMASQIRDGDLPPGWTFLEITWAWCGAAWTGLYP